MFASSGCAVWLLALYICFQYTVVYSSVLTPPYFNLADGRRITATATCGEDVEGPELYCKLIGASSEYIETQENLVIQGQVCDHCDPTRPDKRHPPEYAVDGSETWWQSPPLSRGNKYNEVNLTIDLGQEFHVAYVLIKMANSPRPGVWVLEKSADNGQIWQPWQYFADTLADCESFFGPESVKPITSDDSVICETQYSQIVPLEGGEIVISLLLNRPSANDFFNSPLLQEFTRATNVRFRMLRTKNLLGHLMSVARQDPTVTRRYYYSIKDISIGGRCRCNGHADTCDITDPDDPYKLLCRCQHNTCGHNCEKCCPGFEQKAWSQSKNNKVFICEPCNCFEHTEECVYNETVDALRLSIDIHGNYEGGGVCQNCRDNTEGINCDKCKPGFYRPHGYELNRTDVCQTCECNYFYSTGNCAEGTGQCECRKEFTKPNCDSCSFGYFDYPNCKPCVCHVNGTRGFHCEADGGQCPCKPNYSGKYCERCSEGFYKFPECSACECNPLGSLSDVCDIESGNCTCNSNFGGRTCNQCGNGYYDFPQCTYCNCDARGTEAEVCDKQTGQCLCKTGYGGPRCDQCIPGYNGYPDCKPCGCSEVGSASTICDASGKCPCLYNFVGRTCEQCSPGYYKYPECLPCECNNRGSIGVSCDMEGKCQCRPNFDGIRCEQCKEGLYNFPICEECNCNPAGVLATFAGCGSLPLGELCQCKPRVHGRICDMCRPLYFNLQPYNSDGCEDCGCHMPGVAGNIAECDTKSGQCVCKSSVTSRRCDECVPGTYNLREDNLFGCTDCGCDIGGSVMSSCNKDTGQCVCQPRITGRTCKEPLQAHYFPTLYQFQFEAEEGHTPTHSPVRYGFADDIFPGYSWKGYAVFSQLQNEIIQEVYIQKPSLYRMVLRYINPNNESVVGKITITPDNPSDTEQVHQVLFKPSRQPAFVTVAGPTASIPSPLVMNPGQWSVSIKNDKSIFLDYFVLLPAAFYEVGILVNQVTTPCKLGDSGVCRHFQYPNVTNFDTVHGEGGYLTQAESREPIREFLNDPYTLAALKVPPMPLLNPNQNELFLDLRITRPGPHILLVNYVTPKDSESTSTLDIEARTQKEQDKGRVTLYVCGYTMVCREVVVDKHGKVAVFNFDTNYVNLVLRGDNANVAVESVVAIPEDKWHLDYLKPKQACVKEDGKCVQALFQNPGEAKKIEFEEGNEAQLSTVLPSGIYSNTTGLIYLDHKDAMVDVRGKVPHPGTYIFIVHYYQPDYPEFEMEVLLQNGQFYVGKLPLDHCPANSGCRSIVHQADGNTNFQLTENFVLTLKEPNHKSVWLDYVLVLPAESFTEHVIKEEALDQTIEFITHCAQNNYYVDERVQGFCRDAVFSITSAYNNGAIPCQCDYDGSLSFECEKFGGQCQCRPNVIGKRCEVCKTGYFGFPNCRSCDCPSAALCETTTGDCICPPKVTGENCDKCEPYTFGYDPIIGCEACNCNPLGVERGNLQCNLLNGICECKQNVVGRTCDHCQSGYWSFPYCQECDCDLRGTTLDICDQQTAECFCKSNVYGQACDLCKEGTFNIQENNDDGCTKCFCFGKTTRCSSSSLYRSQIDVMEDWRLAIVTVSKTVNVEIVDESVERIDTTVGADLTLTVFRDKTVYFVASSAYLDNRLTSYGGALNYSIFYTPGPFGSAVGGADVILHGAGMYLLYFAYEQPPASVEYSASLDLVESKFVLPTGLPTTREQIMQVLEKLQGIYIRATYWEDSVTSRLLKVSLDSAMSVYSEKGFALSVEQCQCPPNYQGLSCEECADGYYRATTGPYGGYCVPCQCNGHASTCDKVTGICLDCKHNTTGQHCENCDVGYHGNATGGTPYDCLICACPLPITSNNFATSCDVSEDGERISCECRPGYFGARCESCAAGYYGRPEVQNDYCKPCECSGNINPEDPGSCDSVTGECTKCLNNTSGESCQFCAPGYFGDAVSLKDCQSCVCDRCGTDHCDHFSGICQCLPNVVGDKCDKCADQHYGFTTCRGCNACDCQLASDSLQCDDISGQCRCKPGVVGRNCDRCASGFWEYTSTGCISCGCNTEYSVGVGCNPKTGQCECLPGVIGEKCDHCPHRWVLIEDQGCFECDTCTHALLDIMDYLHNKLQPVAEEFKTVAASYFTTQRLNYINNIVAQLRPEVNELSAHQFDIKPLINTVNDLQQETSALNRKAEYAVENAHGAGGAKIIIDALEVEAVILDAVEQTKATVYEISDLAYNLDSSTGHQIDLALKEAHAILDEITQSDIKAYAQEAEIELVKAEELLARMEEFAAPATNTTSALESLRERIYQIDYKLDDLKNHSQTAAKKADTTQDLNAQNRNANLPDIVNNLRDLYNKANITLVDARNLLSNATLLFDDANKAFGLLNTQWQENSVAKDQLTETLADRIQELDAVQSVVNDARSHSDLLTNQARTLDSLLTDTRYMSESAIKAANAYGNIVYAINESYTAARDALVAAENATAMSNGLGEKTATSNSRSALLLQQAHKALEEAQQELKPQLADAISDVNDVNKMNSKINQIDSDIMKALENIPLPAMKSETEEVVQKADDATAHSENALKQIRGIIAELPATHKGAKQLYKDSEQARNAIINANNELDRVNSILPDLKNLADQLKEKPQKMTELGSHMKVDLDLLKKRVAMARDLADRIKLGVTFFRNSTLELRNPESISHQGLNSHVSIYIKTDKPNGLVLYIGNAKGTSRKMRRAVSDDFMALETQNGFPVLTMDLGSGPEQIIHNKSVSDNNWYQIVMDRTGKSVHFTVREDLGTAHNHAVQTHTVEKILPGTSTLLNLDREHSKVFVGGYPVTFEIQPSVSYSSFDGRMEELFIGDQQVGLWNFVDAININTASRDRDQLVNITTTTGFRLNGEGFIILDGHSYAMKKRSDVTLKFKSFAKDGLLFLALRDLVFLSVELIDGHVRYQYNLGGGVVSISSPNTYNDGQWHTVDAVRVGTQGALKVDGISISKATAPGDITELVVSPKLYVGGYPGEHGLDSVTASGFDGCIDEVQIGSTSVDLNQNINAFEVIAGCPNKFAGVISFEGGARGYARWPNATAREIPVQLILKFKTTGPNGMIAYAADGSASASLYLENGSIIFQSGGQEVKTSPSTSYNDGQWHVVVATSSAAEPLRLDVDDYETFKSPAPAAPIRLLYGNLYFGGVSSNVDAAAALKPQFSGCIGDATLNGVVVNFGNLTDIPNAIIGKCLLDTPLTPDLRTAITSVKRPEIPLVEEEREDVSPQPPPPVQPPIEEVSDSPETTESEGGTVAPLAPPEVVSTTAVPTPLPTPVPMCKLPLYPISDADVTATSGHRFGTKFGSRVEYSQFPGRLKNKYEFSVSIKTVTTEGIIFYVTDQRHIDFISLYLKDGMIHYGFNCGSGPALITSPNPYNDGEWHTIEFTRHLTSGRLIIDGQPVATGDSKGSTKTINVIPPFFLGGIDPRISEQTKINLKGLNSTFEGCLKDFKMNGKPVGQPTSSIGVIPCSENVESGSFFSTDGGYIRAYDKFRVGWEIDIKLDIKPRNISGLLVSVHAKKDYLILQMINGQIKFSVDNGKGEISTAYNPPIPHYFCDGEWHNIQAVKSKNVVTLSVDKNFVDPGIGMSSATDTKHPLYIGGHPNPGRLRGVLTTAQFVGCIRNVEINGNQEKLSTLHAVGNVTQSICPTT